MGKLKSFLIKSFVMSVNLGLVLIGVFLVKNGQEKKQVEQNLATNAQTNQLDQSAVAEQAKQLQEIVQQNKNQKTEAASKNTGTVTVKKPTIVTTNVPAKTKTISVPVASVSSSTSSSKTSYAPAPTKTTKKS